MNSFLKYFIFSFFLTFGDVYSTSTTFDQKMIFNNFGNDLQTNTRSSIQNIQSLAIGSSIGILSNKLYESGFFSPLGLIPEKISNLAPLAYNKNIRIFNEIRLANYCKIKEIKSQDLNDFRYENQMFVLNTAENCYSKKKSNRFLIKELVNRYTEY